MQPERADMNKDLGALSGSRADASSPQAVSTEGFDPARNNPADYTAGWNDAIAHCVAVAERWRDENKAQWVRAIKLGRKRYAFDGDETQLVMAEQLDGAAIECNAMAMEMRDYAIATEAHRAATVEQGAVHEGAGLKGIAQSPSQ